MGIDPGVSRLGGEIVSHNTTDARCCFCVIRSYFVPMNILMFFFVLLEKINEMK